MRFIMSILLGVLPDVLYYFLYIKNIKQTKKHNLIFFSLLFVSYILCIMLVKHQFYLYIVSDLLMFLILKILYKAKITDLFLIVVLELYIMIISLICYTFINNYFIAYVINRVVIFLPLLITKRLAIIYKDYNKLWNRHNEERKLKSITLRNISVLLFNFLMVLIYVILLYITNVK